MSQSTNPQNIWGTDFEVHEPSWKAGYERAMADAREALEADKHRTNTVPRSELVQSSTNPKDDSNVVKKGLTDVQLHTSTDDQDNLDEILAEFGVKIHYYFENAKAVVGDEQTIYAEAKARLQEYITLARIEAARQCLALVHIDGETSSSIARYIDTLQRDSQPGGSNG